jgi:predicted nucleic acid-binding protein
VREVVLDASVVLKWFHSEGEENVEAARAIRSKFEAGELQVTAPPLLWLEVLNVAARRWQWTAAELEKLAATLPALGFLLIEPELQALARWTAQGLTAYDAAYVAVADHAGLVLITDDREIQGEAPEIAIALGSESSALLDMPEPLPLEPGAEPPSSVLRRLRKDER